MKLLASLFAVPFGALTLTSSIRTAIADDVAAPHLAVTRDEAATTGPNRALLHSGIWILGLSYVPAVIVAAESNRYGDKRLYIPVAGPWLDLTTRSNCSMNAACSNETTNKILIVVDGVFQGLGAFNIVGAFVFPETRTVAVSSSERSNTQTSTLSVHILPARVGRGAYGLAAVGTF